MTTPLTISRIWAGETVAVLGNAPSLDAELEHLPRPIHAIACNQAAVRAPWADMMVSIDINWPAAANDYPGTRIVGAEVDGVDAYYVHMPHEEIALAPSNIIHTRSNLLAAIRIAAQAGAARILLLGIDTARYEVMHSAPGIGIGLAALIAEMAARGVIVERFVVPDAEPSDSKGPPNVRR